MNAGHLSSLASLLAQAILAGYGLIVAALALALWRAARGPSETDRISALKLVWLCVIGLMALVALQTHEWRVLDLALALSLLGGVVPLAFAWADRRRLQQASPAETGEADDAGAH